MRTALARGLGLVLALPLAACASGGGSGGSDPYRMLTGNSGGGQGSVPVPSDTRRTGREGLEPPPPTLTATQIQEQQKRSVAAAESMWRQAESIEPRNPEAAADIFHDLSANHPTSPRAAEAKFREGRAAYRAHEYAQAFEALQRYMEIAPANPYLAEVEELVYRSGVQYLASIGSGIMSLFRTEDPGYRMLKFVPQTFPNGVYADDALLALGDAYRKEEDNEGWMRAVLAYKLLVLRYPQSPLVPRARLGLAAAYLARDQGAAWHGGFTDIDPREDMPSEIEKAALVGDVQSGPELALYEYEALIEDARAHPGWATADEVARAQRGASAARERLAAKDQRIAGWYGGGHAAETYRRSAADLRAGAPPGGWPVEPRPPAATPPTPPTTQRQALPPPTPSPAVSPPAVTPPVVAPPAAPPPPPVPPSTPPPTRPPDPQGPTAPPPPGGGPSTSAPMSAPPVPGALPPPSSRRLTSGTP